MCEPISTTAIVMMALSAAGTAYGAYAQKKSANIQEDIANENYKAGKRAANQVVQQGEAEVAAHRDKIRRLRGAQSAMMAGAGGDVSSGSNLDTLTGTEWLGEADALTIRSNARRQAWGIRTNSSIQTSGLNAQAYSTKMGAVGTILGGAADIYGQGYSAGMWGQGTVGAGKTRRALQGYQAYAATNYPMSF